MQGLIRCVVVAGTLLGCGPGGVGPMGDDTPPMDAPAGPSGLIIEWSTSPAIPSTGGPVTITQARFQLSSLRVVGDAGAGDSRTTITNIEMGFSWSGSEPTPPDMIFNDAPTGLYSQVALSFDGGSNESYEIRGRAMVGSEDLEYRIEDDRPLAFNVPIDTMVTPGEMTTVRLRINFTHAIDSLEMSTLDRSDGRLELSDGDAQMPMFRAKLIESFEIVSP